MRPARLSLLGMLVGAALSAGLIQAPPAGATFPGTNGMIAVTSNRSGNQEIYSMLPSGTGGLRLTHFAGIDSNPPWAPNGTKIAVDRRHHRHTDILMINAHG